MKKLIFISLFLLPSLILAQIVTHPGTGGGGEGGDPKDCTEWVINLKIYENKLCPSCKSDEEFSKFVDDQYLILMLKKNSDSADCINTKDWQDLNDLYNQNRSAHINCRYKADLEYVNKVRVLAGKKPVKKKKKK